MTTARAGRDILVLNATLEELGRMNFKDAMRLVVLGKAVVHEADESKEWVRSENEIWLYPKVVILKNFVQVNSKKLYGEALLSKHNVLKRDFHKCAYCGRTAKTIDHVIPKSRFARKTDANTWLNLVAACFKCNNKKDNKTPAEAKMPLKVKPYVPTKAELIGR